MISRDRPEAAEAQSVTQRTLYTGGELGSSFLWPTRILVTGVPLHYLTTLAVVLALARGLRPLARSPLARETRVWVHLEHLECGR